MHTLHTNHIHWVWNVLIEHETYLLSDTIGWCRSDQHCERHYATDMDQAMVWLRRTLWTTSCDWHRSGTDWRGELCYWQWIRPTVSVGIFETSCGWHGSGNGLAETHSASSWRRSGTDLAGWTLRATSYGWHGSGNSLAETYSASNIMRLTWIGQQVEKRFGLL